MLPYAVGADSISARGRTLCAPTEHFLDSLRLPCVKGGFAQRQYTHYYNHFRPFCLCDGIPGEKSSPQILPNHHVTIIMKM